jgi:excisionase family DNA binding protein
MDTLNPADWLLVKRADLEALTARAAAADARAHDPRATLITPAEAAQRLGVSKSTVANLVARGELPAVRLLGRLVRIHPDDVVAFIDQRRKHGQR